VFDPTGPVLGIDPGLSRCGYGVVRREGNQARALGCGVLRGWALVFISEVPA